jgi:Protein of unknown function (DUF3515)
VAGVVALTLLISIVAGCGSVEVRSTGVTGADRSACMRLVDDLPHRVSERPRRETRGSSLGAAWGDPAIVLRCGVGTPGSYEPFSPCQRVDGVDWYAPEEQIDDQGAEVVLTTIGRAPNVEVVVPAEYRPPDAVMVDLARVIKARTEVVEKCA